MRSRPPRRRRRSEFFAPRVLDVECALYPPSETICISERPGYAQEVRLSANGEVVLCTAHPSARGGSCEGNAGEHTPTLGYGRQIRRGRFRCQVLHTGVECTVVSTGKGFIMSRNKVVPVGGASILLASLDLRKFPVGGAERLVVVEDGGCGTNPNPPTRAAEIHSNGTVSLFRSGSCLSPGRARALDVLSELQPECRDPPLRPERSLRRHPLHVCAKRDRLRKGLGRGARERVRINANEAVEVGYLIGDS